MVLNRRPPDIFPIYYQNLWLIMFFISSMWLIVCLIFSLRKRVHLWDDLLLYWKLKVLWNWWPRTRDPDQMDISRILCSVFWYFGSRNSTSCWRSSSLCQSFEGGLMPPSWHSSPSPLTYYLFRNSIPCPFAICFIRLSLNWSLIGWGLVYPKASQRNSLGSYISSRFSMPLVWLLQKLSIANH